MLPPVPFSISLTGPDSPGLVLRILDVLTDRGCRLADARIAQLVGQMTGLLVVYAPLGVTAQDLRDAFEALDVEGLWVQVRDAPDDGWPSCRTPFTEPFMISYEGGDSPGMLHDLARAFDEAGCVLADVSLDSTVGERSNAYVLVCEVESPLPREALQTIADRVGEARGRTLTVIPANLDVWC